jgi:hypothetical protein
MTMQHYGMYKNKGSKLQYPPFILQNLCFKSANALKREMDWQKIKLYFIAPPCFQTQTNKTSWKTAIFKTMKILQGTPTCCFLHATGILQWYLNYKDRKSEVTNCFGTKLQCSIVLILHVSIKKSINCYTNMPNNQTGYLTLCRH